MFIILLLTVSSGYIGKNSDLLIEKYIILGSALFSKILKICSIVLHILTCTDDVSDFYCT